MTTKKSISITLSPKVVKEVTEIAKHESRSRSSVIELVLESFLSQPIEFSSLVKNMRS